MAIAPAPMAIPSSPPAPAGGAAGMMPPDPSGGTGDGSDSGSDVVVTICSDGQGGYTVYAGDEPDAGSGDMSDDDTDAMGSAGSAPAPGGGSPPPQGQPADSIGAALKAALTILQSDASSQGAPGSADDQFSAGFSASKSPTPASGPAQKY
jgi:hypothetical protein